MARLVLLALRRNLGRGSSVKRVRAGELDLLAGLEPGVQADHVRLDGQLAAAALDQGGQHHRGRAAVVEQLVERGADGAPGLQHVVHQHDVAIVHGHRQVRGAYLRVHADAGEVVAVEGDVELPSGSARPSRACRRSATQTPPVWMPIMSGFVRCLRLLGFQHRCRPDSPPHALRMARLGVDSRRPCGISRRQCAH